MEHGRKGRGSRRRWCLQAESKVNSNVFANNFYSLWTVPVFPSYPSLQHVIGHKKLQLCINLLHWSLEGAGGGGEGGASIEWNRIELSGSEAKRKRETARRGRMANGWRGQASTWSAYHYMPSNFNVEPFGQDRQDLSPGGPAKAQGTTTSNKCCKRCKHNNL